MNFLKMLWLTLWPTALCVAVTALVVWSGHLLGVFDASYHEVPRLVGYDCDGTAGPIYAMEEDHLPRCAVIEAN